MSLAVLPSEDRDAINELRGELIQTRLLIAQLLAVQTGERVRVPLRVRPWGKMEGER